MKTIFDVVSRQLVSKEAVFLEAAIVTISASVVIAYCLARSGFGTFAAGLASTLWMVISISYYGRIWNKRA